MKFLFVSALFIAFVCSELVVHEWGTYTSVQGSNGKPLPGCHHGEESLPEFVRSRADTFTHEMWEKLQLDQQNARRTNKKREVDGIVPPPETLDELKKGINCGFCKVMDWIPTFNTTREVTQKLETPVIYFYSPKQINDVTVTVRFPQGIVTEYYPSPVKNLPLVGKVPAVANGAATWKVNVAERDAYPAIPVVSEDSIWAPSRRVNANSVMNTVADENERHIFYRGLGRFEGPLAVSSNETHITIENTGEASIDAAWLLSRSGDNAFLHRLPALAPRAAYSEAIGAVAFMEKYSSIENFLTAASVALEVQLVKTGLYDLEARAMVDTWARSYFLNEGMRVLYIAPQAYPNAVLPWTITPRPASEVRVLVGRVELITKQEEVALGQVVRAVLAHYEASPKKERVIAALLKDTTGFPLEILNAYEKVWSLGRFAESKIRRVLESESIRFEQELVEEWILSALTY